jgi:hypothetical protein
MARLILCHVRYLVDQLLRSVCLSLRPSVFETPRETPREWVFVKFHVWDFSPGLVYTWQCFEATTGFLPIGYRGALLSTLLHVNVYVTHNLLNVLVQIANKMVFKKRKRQCFRMSPWSSEQTRKLPKLHILCDNQSELSSVQICRSACVQAHKGKPVPMLN